MAITKVDVAGCSGQGGPCVIKRGSNVTVKATIKPGKMCFVDH